MAQISITIPDAAIDRVVTAMCETFDYNPSSGLTRNQFAKQCVANWVKRITFQYEQRKQVQDFEASRPNPSDITIT